MMKRLATAAMVLAGLALAAYGVLYVAYGDFARGVAKDAQRMDDRRERGGMLSQGCSCRDHLSNRLRSADTVIHVNGRFQVAVCGYYSRTEKRFSEFTVYSCNDPSRSMGEWGAVKECVLHRTDTSFVVEQLATLPQGPTLQLEVVPCIRTEYYTDGISMNSMTSIVAELPVLDPPALEHLERELAMSRMDDALLNEQQVALAFLCAAHDLGDWRARFFALRSVYLLDGAVAEYYNELKALLGEWPQAAK